MGDVDNGDGDGDDAGPATATVADRAAKTAGMCGRGGMSCLWPKRLLLRPRVGELACGLRIRDGDTSLLFGEPSSM